jgi:hypothetical protein
MMALRWMRAAAAAAIMPVIACTPTAVPAAPDALLGRWIGVEGMYLVVAPGTAPGRYALEMQWDLDHRGRFAGTRAGDAIVFTRDGAQRTLRRTTGTATGLRYLADKSDCLTVMPGEGYCRAQSSR